MEKKYKKCEICRRNTNVKEKYLLARFPLDKERCKKWVKAIGIPELARLTVAQLHYSHFVCGKHFSDNQFCSKNSRLKITAIPTLHLLNPPLSDTLLENFPAKKHLPNTINVTLHVENKVTTAIATHNFMAEHNYFQRIDPSKCDTIAQTDTVAENVKSHSTPIYSSAVDMSEKETRKEMKMENSGATTAETDADMYDTEDYSAPISSSPIGMSEDQNRKTMEINAAVLSSHSPDPTPSSVQSDVAYHSSNVTITNPGPTTSSVQSAVANHSSNVTITNQGPTSSSVQSAVANHSLKYYYYLTNPDPTTSSILSTVANHTSKSMRKLPVTKVDNEEIKKLRADLVKQYRKKTAQKLKETRTKLKEAQKKLWAIESIKSPLLKSLIESEISNRKKKANGKRWSTFTKCLALALYKKSRQAYTYLEKLLPLPTIRTLQKAFQEFQQGAAVDALEQLQPQTEDIQAADTLVFTLADTIVEPLPYEE